MLLKVVTDFEDAFGGEEEVGHFYVSVRVFMSVFSGGGEVGRANRWMMSCLWR